MNGSYFAIECGDQFADHVILMNDDNSIRYEEVMSMSADEINASDLKEQFIWDSFDACKDLFEDVSEVSITLIDDEDCFVWSFIITDLGNEIEYDLIDWCKDGKKFRYADD